jgi:hypothetical protein
MYGQPKGDFELGVLLDIFNFNSNNAEKGQFAMPPVLVSVSVLVSGPGLYFVGVVGVVVIARHCGYMAVSCFVAIPYKKQ